mmetsp:Transcript_4847/g.20778  ORF Transcript_4847/g.20778 Transcript_4847/m.20778 type:complete len:224 (-) Transcript_4847:1102-1773(-)
MSVEPRVTSRRVPCRAKLRLRIGSSTEGSVSPTSSSSRGKPCRRQLVSTLESSEASAASPPGLPGGGRPERSMAAGETALAPPTAPMRPGCDGALACTAPEPDAAGPPPDGLLPTSDTVQRRLPSLARIQRAACSCGSTMSGQRASPGMIGGASSTPSSTALPPRARVPDSNTAWNASNSSSSSSRPSSREGAKQISFPAAARPSTPTGTGPSVCDAVVKMAF